MSSNTVTTTRESSGVAFWEGTGRAAEKKGEGRDEKEGDRRGVELGGFGGGAAAARGGRILGEAGGARSAAYGVTRRHPSFNDYSPFLARRCQSCFGKRVVESARSLDAQRRANVSVILRFDALAASSRYSSITSARSEMSTARSKRVPANQPSPKKTNGKETGGAASGAKTTSLADVRNKKAANAAAATVGDTKETVEDQEIKAASKTPEKPIEPVSLIEAELKTIEIKDQLLTEQLPITPELVQGLRDAGISYLGENTDRALNNRDVRACARALLTDVKSGQQEGDVARMCDALEALSAATFIDDVWKVGPVIDDDVTKLREVLDRHHRATWMADELRHELLAELGQQITSEILELENGRIVHKEYGHEKRLAEMEKKRLLKVLNRKTQCTRDIWERQLERLLKKIEEAALLGDGIDAEARRMEQMIIDFISKHADESEFQHRAVRPKSQATTALFVDPPALHKLQTQIKCLLQLAGLGLMEMEYVQEERRRVGTMIGLSNKKGGLEGHVQKFIDDRLARIAECKDLAIAVDENSDILEQEIVELEKERKRIMDNKQLILNEILRKIRSKEEENNQLAAVVAEIAAEMAVYKVQKDQFVDATGTLGKQPQLSRIVQDSGQDTIIDEFAHLHLYDDEKPDPNPKFPVPAKPAGKTERKVAYGGIQGTTGFFKPAAYHSNVRVINGSRSSVKPTLKKSTEKSKQDDQISADDVSKSNNASQLPSISGAKTSAGK